MIFQRINFHDNKLPVFKENKAKGFVTFGADNLYPDFLIELFNKSPKHNAIVSAKASYVAGIGTEVYGQSTEDIAKIQNKLKSINAYETYEELKAKVAYDAELFNGFAIEVIWNKAKTAPSEYYHIPFKDIRKGLEGEYVYCADWTDTKAEKIHYQPYNPITRESKQLYYCQFYRPGQGEYPLPDYVGALKYIEVDTEISNYYLNSIKNGFTAQTHIQLFKGIPTPEEARATARRFKENYQGTDNAGGLIIQYNDPTEKESVINNLQPSDFDKQFDLLNKTVQQEIFVAHKVNSPMLFGVRVEGQLGGRSELIEAYEMFHHAYIEPRQQKIDDTFAYLLEPIASVRLETINKPPIGLDYQALFTAGVITNEEARKELGLPLITDVKQSSLNDAINALSPLVANNVLSNMTINEKRQLANLPPIAGGDALPSAAPVEAVALSKQNPFGWDDERDIKVFQQYGESADNFEAYKFEFVDAVETAILNVLKENKGLQVGDIVNITKLDAKVVADAIAKLAKAELIKSYEDGLETTPKGVEEVKRLQTEIVVRYKYGLAAGIDGPMIIPGSRDFCRQIDGSNRVYSREDINAMSTQLGYDVWKRRGGWYHNPTLDVNTPQCRHIWQQQLLRRIKR
jgi:predicted transcriptional regulator